MIRILKSGDTGYDQQHTKTILHRLPHQSNNIRVVWDPRPHRPQSWLTLLTRGVP